MHTARNIMLTYLLLLQLAWSSENSRFSISWPLFAGKLIDLLHDVGRYFDLAVSFPFVGV